MNKSESNFYKSALIEAVFKYILKATSVATTPKYRRIMNQQQQHHENPFFSCHRILFYGTYFLLLLLLLHHIWTCRK